MTQARRDGAGHDGRVTEIGIHAPDAEQVWVVIDGEVEFTVGDETARATAGAITTAPAEVPHKFVNVGSGRLRMMCVHASPEIIQFDLE